VVKIYLYISSEEGVGP